MAEKIKKTRPELLRQRRALAMYKRFLPTLQLKKQQLQIEILKVRNERNNVLNQIDSLISHIKNWISLFSEQLPGSITRLISVKEVVCSTKNVAGIMLPVLKEVIFEYKPYSLFATPPWVDYGIQFLKEMLTLKENIKVLIEQENLLHKELKKITQRVNLFEKVMIPKTTENIRVIRIALGEEQVAAVGRAKIAKAKNIQQTSKS